METKNGFESIGYFVITFSQLISTITKSIAIIIEKKPVLIEVLKKDSKFKKIVKKSTIQLIPKDLRRLIFNRMTNGDILVIYKAIILEHFKNKYEFMIILDKLFCKLSVYVDKYRNGIIHGGLALNPSNKNNIILYREELDGEGKLVPVNFNSIDLDKITNEIETTSVFIDIINTTIKEELYLTDFIGTRGDRLVLKKKPTKLTTL